MSISAPRALVLDFGEVILKTLFETHDAEAARRCQGSTDLALAIAEDTDPLWSAMQRRELSERDHWLSRSREVGSSSARTGG